MLKKDNIKQNFKNIRFQGEKHFDGYDFIYELLEDYSDWLHKNNYIDTDYYAEEPKAVEAYIKTLK